MSTGRVDGSSRPPADEIRGIVGLNACGLTGSVPDRPFPTTLLPHPTGVNPDTAATGI